MAHLDFALLDGMSFDALCARRDQIITAFAAIDWPALTDEQNRAACREHEITLAVLNRRIHDAYEDLEERAAERAGLKHKRRPYLG